MAIPVAVQDTATRSLMIFRFGTASGASVASGPGVCANSALVVLIHSEEQNGCHPEIFDWPNVS